MVAGRDKLGISLGSGCKLPPFSSNAASSLENCSASPYSKWINVLNDSSRDESLVAKNASPVSPVESPEAFSYPPTETEHISERGEGCHVSSIVEK